MSFMQQVVQAGPNQWVLPPVGGMRCEVRAFLSEPLFRETDEKLWAQAASSAMFPGAIGMYLMPDTPLGYSIPVGGVLVTEDTIIQGGSGPAHSCVTLA